MPGLMRRLWRRARVLLAGLAVGFLLCEAILRVARMAGIGGVLFYARQDLYWKVFPRIGTVEDLATAVPGAMGPYGRMHGYVLNSRGLRTPEYAVMRRPGVGRYVFLGDSFMCVPGGKDDKRHVANVVARILGGEVVNLGLPTAGPKFYQRMLEVEGVRLKPDCAVVFLFVGNDLTEEGDVDHMDSITDLLTAYSYLFRLGRNLSRLTAADFQYGDERMRRFHLGDPRKGGFFGGCPDCWPWFPTLSQARFDEVQAERAVVFASPWPDWLELHWKSLSKTVAQMAQTAAENRIPVLFVLIPDETQVEPGVREKVRRRFDGASMDWELPQKKVSGLCASLGIPVLDLLPAFRRADAQGVRVYLPRDTHWTPEAQELAGRLVAAKIRQLLPSK
jgi:hypothetical protein